MSRVTPGTIRSHGGGTIPYGWLAGDGSEVLIATYPALNQWIGRVFGLDTDGSVLFGSRTNGAGAAGTTHIKLPDSAGRATVGSGVGTGITTRTLAQRTGSETHVLSSAETSVPVHDHPTSTAAHGTHSVTDPGHIHTSSGDVNGGNAIYGDGRRRPSSSDNNAGSYPNDIRTSDDLTATGVTVAGDTANLAVTIGAASGGAASAHPIIQPILVVSKIIKY